MYFIIIKYPTSPKLVLKMIKEIHYEHVFFVL